METFLKKRNSSERIPPNIEELARLHPTANDPYKPFCGVGALFNGDLQLCMGEHTDRADWEVLSPYNIRYIRDTVVLNIDRDDQAG